MTIVTSNDSRQVPQQRYKTQRINSEHATEIHSTDDSVRSHRLGQGVVGRIQHEMDGSLRGDSQMVLWFSSCFLNLLDGRASVSVGLDHCLFSAARHSQTAC